MALRAYVHRRPGKADGAVRKRGDVVSIHLAENPVASSGSRCATGYLIVENWPDAQLEAAMRAAGKRVVAYPYAQYETRDLVDGRGRVVKKIRRMVQQSARYIDFASLPAQQRGALTSRSVAAPRDFAGLTVSNRSAPVVRSGWKLEGRK